MQPGCRTSLEAWEDASGGEASCAVGPLCLKRLSNGLIRGLSNQPVALGRRGAIGCATPRHTPRTGPTPANHGSPPLPSCWRPAPRWTTYLPNPAHKYPDLYDFTVWIDWDLPTLFILYSTTEPGSYLWAGAGTALLSSDGYPLQGSSAEQCQHSCCNGRSRLYHRDRYDHRPSPCQATNRGDTPLGRQRLALCSDRGRHHAWEG